jgi:hypothetical protein
MSRPSLSVTEFHSQVSRDLQTSPCRNSCTDLCMSAGQHTLNGENKIEGGRVSRPAPGVHARLSQPSARHFARRPVFSEQPRASSSGCTNKYLRAAHAAVLICLALWGAASCQPQRPLPERAPAAVPEGSAKWNRTGVEAIPSGELLPGSVSSTRLIYTGPLSITVDLYQMPSGSSAFEAVQKWRTTPGKSIAYRNDLFLVFNSSQPDKLPEFATPFLAGLH